MVDIDIDQNQRIHSLENRLNDVESNLSAIQAQLSQATSLLKIIGVGVGMALGIDLQGLMI